MAVNNFTNNLISRSQIHFSVVKESQIPFKPHPTPVCMTEIMKKITLAISRQTCLPQHTRKGTAAEAEAVCPLAGSWQRGSWSSGAVSMGTAGNSICNSAVAKYQPSSPCTDTGLALGRVFKKNPHAYKAVLQRTNIIYCELMLFRFCFSSI